MQNDARHLLNQIEDVLEAERRAIRGGGLSGLGALAVQKAALLDQLQPALPLAPSEDMPERLGRMKRRAADNHRLLGAALNGVRAARNRIDIIVATGHSLNTYDSKGRAQSYSFAPNDVERRA